MIFYQELLRAIHAGWARINDNTPGTLHIMNESVFIAPQNNHTPEFSIIKRTFQRCEDILPLLPKSTARSRISPTCAYSIV